MRYLQSGEHDPVLSVLNTWIHQVFDQADLRAQVPDAEIEIKWFYSFPDVFSMTYVTGRHFYYFLD